MILKELKLTNFRNFREKLFNFSENFIVFEGKNGTGKSNILESIYLLCTGKSYRNAKKNEMINFNSEHFFIEGNFFFKNNQVSVALSFNNEKKNTYFKDSLKKETFFDWFNPPRPVISFSSNDINLIYGPPENRRKFIDFLGSILEPLYLRVLLEYRYWLNCKNNILHGSFDACLCDIYDEKISVLGTEIVFTRLKLIEKLRLNLNRIYNTISANTEVCEIAYDLSLKLDKISKNECKNVFYNMLHDCRKKDLRLGYSSFGPHRDDVSILLNGSPARYYSSQGQCRTLALSIKLSSSITLESNLNEQLIYLIDDTISELDTNRTDNFFPLIKTRGQVFMASPEGKISRNNEFSYFRVSSED